MKQHFTQIENRCHSSAVFLYVPLKFLQVKKLILKRNCKTCINTNAFLFYLLKRKFNKIANRRNPSSEYLLRDCICASGVAMLSMRPGERGSMHGSPRDYEHQTITWDKLPELCILSWASFTYIQTTSPINGRIIPNPFPLSLRM